VIVAVVPVSPLSTQLAPPSVLVWNSYPVTLETLSVAPDAVTSTDATFCQLSDPPATVGAVGAVRSRRTRFAAPGDDGDQAVALPALSRARTCTRVSPSAVITAAPPSVAVPQLEPPSVLVRYWNLEKPEIASLPPVAVMVREAALNQVFDPPLTPMEMGAVRSIRAVLPAVADAGLQALVFPALSRLRNCTSVSPSAVMSMLAPGEGVPHVEPPSVLVRSS